MIVRILEEGQYDVSDDLLIELDSLDDEVVAAIEAHDHGAFDDALGRLLERVRAGDHVPDDYLGPSELVLPAPDSSLEEVEAMLGEEGLVPG